MNRFVLIGLGALALAACKPAPTDPVAPAPAAPTNESPKPVATTETPSAAAAGQGPSFDCAKAASDAEKAVCGDARLSALDRELAALYKAAQTGPGELDIAAEQRGWIKGVMRAGRRSMPTVAWSNPTRPASWSCACPRHRRRPRRRCNTSVTTRASRCRWCSTTNWTRRLRWSGWRATRRLRLLRRRQVALAIRARAWSSGNTRARRRWTSTVRG